MEVGRAQADTRARVRVDRLLYIPSTGKPVAAVSLLGFRMVKFWDGKEACDYFFALYLIKIL